jgi:ParB-like chromosome segregation protein Spo0J
MRTPRKKSADPVSKKKPARVRKLEGVVVQTYTSMPIAELKPHPDNPRKGDMRVLRESLEQNDFYGAPLVQKSTGFILAGKHRWMAAKEKGLKRLPVIVLDVDDARARRIMLVDNRSNDIAGYDDEKLKALLQATSEQAKSLLGTGFGQLDLAKLVRQFEPQVDQPRLDLLKTYTVKCPHCGQEFEFKPNG